MDLRRWRGWRLVFELGANFFDDRRVVVLDGVGFFGVAAFFDQEKVVAGIAGSQVRGRFAPCFGANFKSFEELKDFGIAEGEVDLFSHSSALLPGQVLTNAQGEKLESRHLASYNFMSMADDWCFW